MTAHPLLTLAAMVAQADVPESWLRPGSAGRQIFSIQYQVDYSHFEALKTGREEWTAPLVSSGGTRVYVAVSTGRLEALDLHSGTALWSQRDVGTVGAAMTTHQGALILSLGTDLVALEEDTGRERWRTNIGGRVGGPIHKLGSRAIVPVRPNGFVAVDLEEGEIVWRIRRPTSDNMTVRGQAGAGVDPKRGRVLLGFSDGVVVAADADTGAEQWTASLGNSAEFFPDVDTEPLWVDEDSVVAASYNAGLFRLKADTGEVAWKREITSITGLAHLRDIGVLVATLGDGQVLGLRPSDGTIGWRYRLGRGAPTDPVDVGNGRVAVGSSHGALTVLHAKTGEPLQWIRPGSGLSVAPAFNAPHLVFLTNRGRLFSLTL